MKYAGNEPSNTDPNSRMDAMEALVFAIAHHLRVEAPHVARPIALRLNLHAGSEGLSPDAQQLFRQVSRLLG